jgi:phospholipase/carboxylesterase
VPTATDTELISFGDWTLRVRASQSKSPRLLVLLHGWTGDENSMWIFTRGFSPDYWMMAPRAPHAAEPGGFSWRPLQASALRQAQGSTFGLPSLETLLPAADGLLKLIDEYSASVKLDALQFDLMGFSQGAAMVNLIGMLHPHRIRKMGVLAGFVPAGLEQLIPQKPLAGKMIFVAHGTQDQMIPVDRARASMELLEQAGAQITYCEDEVGHKLSANCLRALENYLSSPERPEGVS